MALTIARWKHLKSHGKTCGQTELVAPQMLGDKIKTNYDPMLYLENCSTAIEGCFESIETELNVDFDE